MEASYGSDYDALYHHHWWWRARESILLEEIRALSLPTGASILDVGCGNGLFLPKLARFGRVEGIEVDASLVRDDAPLRDAIHLEPLGHPVYAGRLFDLVTALDVIEHLDDDRGFVRLLAERVRPGGHLLVTVPAFPILWDVHDEINHHRRRYRREGLRQLLAPYGDLRSLRFLFPSLFAAKVAVAWRNHHAREALVQASLPPPLLGRALAAFLRAEDAVARHLRLPFGTSLLALLRIPDAA